MKRLLAVLLAVFLLSGCAGQGGIFVSKPVNVAPVHDEQRRWDAASWSLIYYSYLMDQPFDVTLPGSESELSYDGDSLTLTNAGTTRTFACLVSCPWQDKRSYTECLILSNDPNITAATRKDEDVIILQSTVTFRLTKDRGEIPKFITELENYGYVTYGRESFYQVRQQENGWCAARYDYHGNLKSKTEALSANGSIWELENGGFLYSYEEDYPTRFYALECYDSAGKLCWQHRFSDQYHTRAADIIEHDGKLWYFGTAQKSEDSDQWYVCVLSQNGALLQEAYLGGSNFDWIDHVAKTEEGFTVYGTTYSWDGDFPFSGDGYGQSMVAVLDFDLQLKSAEKAEDVLYSERIGYYQGKPAYAGWDDTPVPMQQVPEPVYTADGVFDYAGGYVVKHYRSLGVLALLDNPPMMSRTVRYREVIYTGYSADGTALWQYARVVV